MPAFDPINDTIELGEWDKTSIKIGSLIDSGKPFMVSRFGSIELEAMTIYLNGRHPFCFLRSVFPFWSNPDVNYAMSNNSGFFPTSHAYLCRFSDLLYESAKQVDILGSWMKNESIVDANMNYQKVPLATLEPFWSSHPWTAHLKGKRVLVVHPFATSIESQYKRRELLFDNTELLPEFASFSVIPAVQSLGGESNGFKDWFEALEYMENQIDSVDYDVALLGCGAYGMPLAAHCKKMGKQAIHVGGALQLFFGIKGKRWEVESSQYENLMKNKYWIRPVLKEHPQNADKVENGCYW